MLAEDTKLLAQRQRIVITHSRAGRLVPAFAEEGQVKPAHEVVLKKRKSDLASPHLLQRTVACLPFAPKRDTVFISQG